MVSTGAAWPGHYGKGIPLACHFMLLTALMEGIWCTFRSKKNTPTNENNPHGA
jgi:hypothetical protein